ncbi:MAG: hypothetical protein BroJett011_64800 [Chloroflexota bacterium]|nr:MAG: hypothetical protein BroJett011_64800 [Chloroflexota bacterium]
MNVEVALAIPLIILLLLVILRRESDIDVTVKRSKILENRLKREFNAQGEGLGQLAKSVKGKLPPGVNEALEKTIVPMRNDVVHKLGHDNLTPRRKFIQDCDYVEARLDGLNPPRRARNYSLGCLFVSSMLAAFAYVLSQTLD